MWYRGHNKQNRHWQLMKYTWRKEASNRLKNSYLSVDIFGNFIIPLKNLMTNENGIK